MVPFLACFFSVPSSSPVPHRFLFAGGASGGSLYARLSVAGLKFPCGGLRPRLPRSRSLRSPYLADGAPLEWISEQIGHSEVDTTRKHYARWKPAREYAILDGLNRARSESGHKADTAAPLREA